MTGRGIGVFKCVDEVTEEHRMCMHVSRNNRETGRADQEIIIRSYAY